MKKESLGNVIKARREELGIKQLELAHAVGINSSTISRLESNPKIVADPKTLKLLADELQLDYNYLLSLNKTIDDQKEVRIFSRAAKNMDNQQIKSAIEILKEKFPEAFKNTESDVLTSKEKEGTTN